jgi:HEAT repeat protein
VEFVGMDDERPPQPLLGLRTAEQREAVGELLAQYTGTVRGESRRRVAAFVSEHGYADAAAGDLGARRAWRRGTAAKTLGDFGVARSTGDLSDALTSDSSVQVRVAAARALGRVGDRSAAADLIAACGRGLVPAGVAAQALLDIGSDALPWLLGALEAVATTDPDVGARVAACEALGRVGGHEAALAIAAATGDGAAAVRRAACDAASRLMATETAGAVQRALNDRSAEVQRSAARAAVLLGLAGDSPFLAEAEAELAWGWS